MEGNINSSLRKSECFVKEVDLKGGSYRRVKYKTSIKTGKRKSSGLLTFHGLWVVFHRTEVETWGYDATKFLPYFSYNYLTFSTWSVLIFYVMFYLKMAYIAFLKV